MAFGSFEKYSEVGVYKSSSILSSPLVRFLHETSPPKKGRRMKERIKKTSPRDHLVAIRVGLDRSGLSF